MLENHGLLAIAHRIEAVIRHRLEALATEVGTIAEVRGRGAMMALELVSPGTLEPAPELARAVAARCHAQGVVILVCGTFGNVVRLLPPLVIGEDLLVEALDILAEALRSQA
jgi:4-aminobutyrate aminotransferase/(S)-3-amino-2-methylpropionate transaminase